LRKPWKRLPNVKLISAEIENNLPPDLQERLRQLKETAED